MPLRLAAASAFDGLIVCSFCDAIAPAREFLRDQGWPQVRLVARFD
jgi:hypothetical protein